MSASSEWWRNAIVYQVYVRSYADGNGDGTGDVRGLRDRLDYLRDLGVDALWINPWYSSPLRDGGYDVADYRSIDPRFGTVEEVEEFIGEAHDRNIRVIADLVPNHTSSHLSGRQGGRVGATDQLDGRVRRVGVGAGRGRRLVSPPL